MTFPELPGARKLSLACRLAFIQESSKLLGVVSVAIGITGAGLSSNGSLQVEKRCPLASTISMTGSRVEFLRGRKLSLALTPILSVVPAGAVNW